MLFHIRAISVLRQGPPWKEVDLGQVLSPGHTDSPAGDTILQPSWGPEWHVTAPTSLPGVQVLVLLFPSWRAGPCVTRELQNASPYLLVLREIREMSPSEPGLGICGRMELGGLHVHCPSWFRSSHRLSAQQ